MRRVLLVVAIVAATACYDFSGYHEGSSTADAGSSDGIVDGGGADAGVDDDGGTTIPTAQWSLAVDDASTVDFSSHGLVVGDDGIRVAYRDTAADELVVSHCTVDGCTPEPLITVPPVKLLAPQLVMQSGGLYRIAGGVTQAGLWEGTTTLSGNPATLSGASIGGGTDNVGLVRAAVDARGDRALACGDATAEGAHRTVMFEASAGGTYGAPQTYGYAPREVALAVAPDGAAFAVLVVAANVYASHSGNSLDVDQLSTSSDLSIAVAATTETTYAAWVDTSTSTIRLATHSRSGGTWTSEDTRVVAAYGAGLALDVGTDGTVVIADRVDENHPILVFGRPGGPWTSHEMPDELAGVRGFHHPSIRFVDGVVHAIYTADTHIAYVRYGP